MNELVDKIQSYFYNARTKGRELTPIYCPFCNGGTSKDKYTFSINIDTGAYNCLRGSCGEKGSAYELAKHLNIDTTDYRKVEFRQVRPEKVYKKPEYVHRDLTKEIVDYFKVRMISQDTLIKNKVTADAKGNIQFNYYLDNELVFIKYKLPRKPNKGEAKSWRDAGSKPILYGMDECDFNYPLIIVEGEPDKLVLDECGIKNAVSIPSGTKEMSWIENCWDWLENFKEIILWGDNDKAGKDFVQATIVRLDYWKLRVVKCTHKDPNVLLYKEGQKVVANHIKNATEIKSDFITDMADVARIDYENIKAVPMGFYGMDKLLGGTYMGQLTVWTGFNGSGKSTIVGQALLNGIEAGEKAFIYSGELPKEDVKEWLDLQLLGESNVSFYYSKIKRENIYIPNPIYFGDMDNFYRDMFFIYDTDDYANEIEVFKAMEYMVKREGVTQIMLDNLLTIPLEGAGDINDKTKALINKLKKFARKYNVAVHLVAHQRKPQTGEEERPTKYGISGSASISDLADRSIGVHRLSKEERLNEYVGFNTLAIIFKDRKFGVFNQEVPLGFEYKSKRFYSDDSEKVKKYLWKEGVQQWDKALSDEIPF